MSVQVRRRRETAAFLSTFVGAQGELLVDTTNNRVQVHDGTTPGGFPAARLADLPSSTSPLALSQGGTGAATAKAARASLGLDSFAAVGDANYTAQASDRAIAITASLTAPRTLTLPSASSLNPGAGLRVVDQAGGISATNTLTIAAAGSDTLNGAASAVLRSAFTDVHVVTDGVAKWTYDVQGIARGGTGATSATAALVALGAIGRTTVVDANTTVLGADRTIAITSLTASRTITLPSASAYPTGLQLLVVDESGQCSAANAITVVRAGTDTINGGASAAIQTAYGYLAFESNGSNKWTIVDATPAGGVVSNFAAAADPTSSNDSTQGYAPGSFWLRTDTGDAWRCRNATAGAAVWLRLDQADFFGYVANNWYLPLGNGGTAAQTGITANQIRFLPWINKQRFTMSAVGLVITTLAAAGNAQIALYRADPTNKRPTGNPIFSTASLSTAATGNVSAVVSAQLDPGLYWWGTNADNATVKTQAAAAGSALAPQIIGSATEANLANATAFGILQFLSATFGTWPDMTGQALSEQAVTGPHTTVPHFKVGSLP